MDVSYSLSVDHPIARESFDPTADLEKEVKLAEDIDLDGVDPVDEIISRGMRTARYNAGTEPIVFLGAHSYRVMKVLEKAGAPVKLRFYGLHHDSAEPFLGDIVRPVRKHLEGIESTEMQILESLWDYYGVENPTESQWSRVMEADEKVLIWELDKVYNDGRSGEIIRTLHSRNGWDKSPDTLIDEVDQLIDPGMSEISRSEARRKFLDSHRELLSRI